MAAVRPAGPEPRMTILEWFEPVSAPSLPLPAGLLTAVELASSSTMVSVGKLKGDLSIGLHRSRVAYPRGVFRRGSSCSGDRAGLAQAGNLWDHLAADQLELLHVPHAADRHDRVLRAGLRPCPEPIDELGRR